MSKNLYGKLRKLPLMVFKRHFKGIHQWNLGFKGWL